VEGAGTDTAAAAARKEEDRARLWRVVTLFRWATSDDALILDFTWLRRWSGAGWIQTANSWTDKTLTVQKMHVLP
jgi:hypothetical protein